MHLDFQLEKKFNLKKKINLKTLQPPLLSRTVRGHDVTGLARFADKYLGRIHIGTQTLRMEPGFALVAKDHVVFGRVVFADGTLYLQVEFSS